MTYCSQAITRSRSLAARAESADGALCGLTRLTAVPDVNSSSRASLKAKLGAKRLRGTVSAGLRCGLIATATPSRSFGTLGDAGDTHRSCRLGAARWLTACEAEAAQILGFGTAVRHARTKPHREAAGSCPVRRVFGRANDGTVLYADGQGCRRRSRPRCRTATAPPRLVASVRPARSVMALQTVAGD